MSKNPDMSESTAWAVATQQSHAAGKSPKSYGTSRGREKAKAKFDKPKKDYVQTAKPKQAAIVSFSDLADAGKWVGRKITNADKIDKLTEQITRQQKHLRNTHIVMGGAGVAGTGAALGSHHQKIQQLDKSAAAIDGYSLAVFSGFSDEMKNIGFNKEAGRFGEAAKTFGHYVAGGPKTDLATVVQLPQGRLSKFLGITPELGTVNIPNAGPRIGNGLGAIKNPETRSDALKVLGARSVAGAGAAGLGVGAIHHHRMRDNQNLQNAYVSGAKDMLSQNSGK